MGQRQRLSGDYPAWADGRDFHQSADRGVSQRASIAEVSRPKHHERDKLLSRSGHRRRVKHRQLIVQAPLI